MIRDVAIRVLMFLLAICTFGCAVSDVDFVACALAVVLGTAGFYATFSSKWEVR